MFTLGDVLASKGQPFPIIKSGSQVIAEIDAQIDGIRQKCSAMNDQEREARRNEIDTRLSVIEPELKRLDDDFEYMSETYEGCDWCCGGGDERWADNVALYNPLEKERDWLVFERSYLNLTKTPACTV